MPYPSGSSANFYCCNHLPGGFPAPGIPEASCKPAEGLFQPFTASFPDSHRESALCRADKGGKQPGKCFLPTQSTRNWGLSHKARPGSRLRNVPVPRHSLGWSLTPPLQTCLKLSKSLADVKLENSSSHPGRSGFLPFVASHRREVE